MSGQSHRHTAMFTYYTGFFPLPTFQETGHKVTECPEMQINVDSETGSSLKYFTLIQISCSFKNSILTWIKQTAISTAALADHPLRYRFSSVIPLIRREWNSRDNFLNKWVAKEMPEVTFTKRPRLGSHPKANLRRSMAAAYKVIKANYYSYSCLIANVQGDCNFFLFWFWKMIWWNIYICSSLNYFHINNAQSKLLH